MEETKHTQPINIESGFANTIPTEGTTLSPLNSRLNPQVQPAPIPPFNAGGLGLGIVGRFVSLDGRLFSTVGAMINAIQTDRDLNIMFNPKILCQDNHTARIFVGTNVAFKESTISEPGSTLGGSSETFSWSEGDATVDGWWLMVGTSVGAGDIFSSGWLGAATSSITVAGLPTDGSNVYVRLFCYQGGWEREDYETPRRGRRPPAGRVLKSE